MSPNGDIDYRRGSRCKATLCSKPSKPTVGGREDRRRRGFIWCAIRLCFPERGIQVNHLRIAKNRSTVSFLRGGLLLCSHESGGDEKIGVFHSQTQVAEYTRVWFSPHAMLGRTNKMLSDGGAVECETSLDPCMYLTQVRSSRPGIGRDHNAGSLLIAGNGILLELQTGLESHVFLERTYGITCPACCLGPDSRSKNQ